MKLPVFSVKRRVTVTMLTILIVIFGIVSFTQLGFEMLPDLDYPTISIVTTYYGASSEDIEEVITKPLETAIAGVKRIKTIKSESVEDFSMIMVEFEWGTNLDFAAQDLRDAIDMSLDYLPDDADRPMVLKFNLSQMPVLFYGITGMRNTYELRKLIEEEVESKLKHLDGVASIMIMGGEEAEKQVIIDKDKLTENKISIDDIVQVLISQNLNLSSGHIDRRHKEYQLRIKGEYQSNEEIAETPISLTNDGQVIYLKDIAVVREGFKEKNYIIRTDLRSTVMMMVSKESGANTLNVSDRVKRELEIIKEDLPSDIKFANVFDQGHIVSKVTSKTGENILYGGLLAILVMLFFLGNWRPTLIISLAIPISIITTFVAVYLAGFSLNIMTLGGLALGVGMLVDNAIVVIENIYRHVEKGEKKIQAAKIGASEVGMAITASTLTTISVFAPILFVKGITGQLVKGLALTVAFSLFASLFVALTIVPMLASIIFKKRKKANSNKRRLDLFGSIKGTYLKVLNWSLKHRVKTIVAVLTIFIGSIFLATQLGTEFIPKADMPMQTIMIKMPVGTELEVTNNIIKQIEDIILSIKEVKTEMSLIGPMTEGGATADPTNPTSSNEATIFFRLYDKKERKRNSDEILDEIRKKLPAIKGMQYNVLDMSGQMTGGTESPITIKLYGLDLNKLQEISIQIENRIKNIRGVIDLENSYRKGKPEFQIIINKDKVFQYGLTTAQVANAIKTSVYGRRAGIFRKEGEEIDILVRLPEKDRNTLEKIESINVSSPFGFEIPVKQIAEIKPGAGPIKISREQQTRKVTISANTHERDLGSIVNDIRKEIEDIEEILPTGYFIEFGGSYEDMKETFTVLFLALLLAILIVYVILASLFESFIQPFVIMLTVPLAIIGVIILLFITGTSLSLPSFVGIIILAGIVVNNAIVLIDHTNQLRKSGMEKHKSIIQAGSDRMRPVLITAITTICGMLPLAISTSQGSELRAPMSIAVIGGLLSATFFTLIIIPVVYSLIDRISFKKNKKKDKN